ncbi:MAG: hypothetical protein H0V82_01785 [Candidatus Protochlamydia sp.]|nr:hypothetical protein [Candidatus Protochlamydia sp.]
MNLSGNNITKLFQTNENINKVTENLINNKNASNNNDLIQLVNRMLGEIYSNADLIKTRADPYLNISLFQRLGKLNSALLLNSEKIMQLKKCIQITETYIRIHSPTTLIKLDDDIFVKLYNYFPNEDQNVQKSYEILKLLYKSKPKCIAFWILKNEIHFCEIPFTLKEIQLIKPYLTYENYKKFKGERWNSLNLSYVSGEKYLEYYPTGNSKINLTDGLDEKNICNLL